MHANPLFLDAGMRHIPLSSTISTLEVKIKAHGDAAQD
jgi:hypothetical protein